MFDIFHLQPEASEIKVREHSTPQEDDHEPVWSFLVPVIADESLQSVQLFFQKKQLLNAASRTQNLIVASDRAHPFQGSFFKSTARKLDLDSMKEDTIMVMTSLRALMYYIGHISQKLTGEASREHKSKVVEKYRSG